MSLALAISNDLFPLALPPTSSFLTLDSFNLYRILLPHSLFRRILFRSAFAFVIAFFSPIASTSLSQFATRWFQKQSLLLLSFFRFHSCRALSPLRTSQLHVTSWMELRILLQGSGVIMGLRDTVHVVQLALSVIQTAYASRATTVCRTT